MARPELSQHAVYRGLELLRRTALKDPILVFLPQRLRVRIRAHELLVHGLPNETIQHKLLASAARDIEELLPQLEPRAKELAALAIESLGKRGEREEKDLREILERQRERVRVELAKHEREFQQLTLDFDDDEKRQLESNMKSWRGRLEQFERDLGREPQRIREFYEVCATRVEPVGLVYLWPETG
jgi:hypothetical protein